MGKRFEEAGSFKELVVEPALEKSDSIERLEFLWKKTTANARKKRKDILDKSSA